ncbi:hypothetical protein D3C78_1519440 [compost metagenome]
MEELVGLGAVVADKTDDHQRHHACATDHDAHGAGAHQAVLILIRPVGGPDQDHPRGVYAIQVGTQRRMVIEQIGEVLGGSRQASQQEENGQNGLPGAAATALAAADLRADSVVMLHGFAP